MVGIGGGVPSKAHDIRLGDVVVSAPCDKHGGVLQYDFGKTIQNKRFERTKFLDQPPRILRNAISGLRTQYKRHGHSIAKDIDRILDNEPRMRQDYRRPDPSSDRLYHATYVHPDGQGKCTNICSSNPFKLFVRPDRGPSEDNPAIHYGLIASANQVMKDASFRDTLAKEKDVLCFEMEAAGLMNHFPCLVIRGICDYSDTHKNDDWQEYAAMTAAAYARDLLLQIAPNDVEATEVFISSS